MNQGSIWQIKFKGKLFLLVGDKNNGAICTIHQFENFLPSYAHLFLDGNILRFQKKIGEKKDIQFVKEIPEKLQTKMATKGLASFMGNPFFPIDSMNSVYKAGKLVYDGKPLFNPSSKGVRGNERQPILIKGRKGKVAEGSKKGT